VTKFAEMIFMNEVTSKAATKLKLFSTNWSQFAEHRSRTQVPQQSVTKLTEMIVAIAVTPKAATKLELLNHKHTSVS